MNGNRPPFEFLCRTFPGIDVRLIKATVLEHGDDIESAISFLLDNFEQEKGSTLQVLDLIENYKSFLSLNTQAGQINHQLIEAETPPIPNAESQAPVQLDYGSWVNEGILNSDGMFVNPEKEAEAQFRSPEMSSEYVECEQSGITGCYDGASIAKTSENEHAFSEADHTEQSESDGSHNAVVTGTECVTESYHEATMTSIKELSTTSLEEIVIQAHKDKDDLVHLIKEVSDLRAKAAEESLAAQKAKDEAARGGEDLLVKAAETRTRVLQMKQDNLMHRGEIYGEQAVLALEARELKLRLEQVKQEKEKAVATLLQIRTRLQACYEAAFQEKSDAEMHREAKEQSARKVLEKEEALLAIEEEESCKLNIEAENTARLRERIVDHGSIIDVLQGEISVLCEDVESFKKQVEEGIWSSMSTASTHSGVNPGGPYSFRRHHQLSTDSMHIDSRRSIGSHTSDSMARSQSADKNTSSSSPLDEASHENRVDHSWSSSMSHMGGMSEKSVYLTDLSTSFSIAMDPAAPPLGLNRSSAHDPVMLEEPSVDISYGYGVDSMLPRRQDLNRDRFENGDSFLRESPHSSIQEQAKDISSLSDSPSYAALASKGMADGDWILTSKQLRMMCISSSSSSSTSSLVKLGIDDFLPVPSS